MAVSSTIEYCSERDLKDIYPGLSGFDTKIRVHGWTSLGNSLYRSDNCGLITALYKDGKELGATVSESAVIYSDAGVNTNETFAEGDTTLTLESSGGADNDIVVGQFIRLTSVGEKMLIIAESSDNLTVVRGLFDTSQTQQSTNADVYAGGGLLLDQANEWVYDSGTDSLFIYSSTDPNNAIMESGEDWATLKTRQMRNASRYLESKIDGRLSREIWKDREGEYPYIIKRTTALLAVTFLVRADDPANPVADAFMEEADSNIEQLNSGAIQLPNAVTYDSSKGVIRDVTYTSGSIRPVKTRGRYSGTYDLVKIKIGTGGALGTATFNVYAKDSTKLKNDQVVTEEVITGDYQSVAGGLQIRFAGSTDSSVATANNEWEIELYGSGEQVSNTGLGAIHMSRGGYGSVWR